MENQSNPVTKSAMNYGLYMGLALVLNSVVFYVLGKPFSNFTAYLSYAVIIGFLSWALWSFSESLGEQGLTYGRALGFGTLISLFASLIVAFYTFVLFKIVDPGLLDKLMIFIEETLIKAGRPDNQVDMMINMYKKVLSPLTYSIGQIFNLTILGFIFSLIISIFFRRQPSDPFHGVE
jgi:hypothetical protein